MQSQPSSAIGQRLNTLCFTFHMANNIGTQANGNPRQRISQNALQVCHQTVLFMHAKEELHIAKHATAPGPVASNDAAAASAAITAAVAVGHVVC